MTEKELKVVVDVVLNEVMKFVDRETQSACYWKLINGVDSPEYKQALICELKCKELYEHLQKELSE